MLGTALSSRGYSIPRASMSSDDYEATKRELTVSPFVPLDFRQENVSKNVLYFETKSRIYVPKCYGLSHFGIPATNRLPKGKDLLEGLEFRGSLRPEQVAPVAAILESCQNSKLMGGILNLYCGGGKTTMALYAMMQLKKKTLIVVHKDFLLNQWSTRINEFIPGARIGLIKAKVIDVEDKDVVIASLQSLSMKDYDPVIFESFGLAIVDEVHHASAEVFSRALCKIAFTYTIGLTATIKRKDGLTNVFIWYLGDVAYADAKRKDKIKVQITEYANADPNYSGVHTLYCPGARGTRPNLAKMINNICGFQPRNELILKLIQDVFEKEPNRKMLVLSDRRAHLESLYAALSAGNLSCGLYMGGMRSDVLAQCETKQIILATYAIASEGYDQKGLDTILLASPKSDVVQSVGRILREKEGDRQHVPLVIDIVDMFSLFKGQGHKRAVFYRQMD